MGSSMKIDPQYDGIVMLSPEVIFFNDAQPRPDGRKVYHVFEQNEGLSLLDEISEVIDDEDYEINKSELFSKASENSLQYIKQILAENGIQIKNWSNISDGNTSLVSVQSPQTLLANLSILNLDGPTSSGYQNGVANENDDLESSCSDNGNDYFKNDPSLSVCTNTESSKKDNPLDRRKSHRLKATHHKKSSISEKKVQKMTKRISLRLKLIAKKSKIIKRNTQPDKEKKGTVKLKLKKTLSIKRKRRAIKKLNVNVKVSAKNAEKGNGKKYVTPESIKLGNPETTNSGEPEPQLVPSLEFTRCLYCKKIIKIINFEAHVHNHLNEQTSDVNSDFDNLVAGTVDSAKPLSNKESFMCNMCRFSSESTFDILSHVDIHHKGTSTDSAGISQDGCRDNYHYCKQDGIVILICRLCGYMSRLVGLMRTHIRRHDAQEFHLCSHCDFRTVHPSLLKFHITKIHVGNNTEKMYACPNCDYVTTSYKTMVQHSKADKCDIFNLE